MIDRFKVVTATIAGVAAILALADTEPARAQEEADRPNILVIWGDDIGLPNISWASRGMMGYETPNIDRIAEEGMFFTDYYGEQSCTAGRASFITGQIPVRTGLTKVGLPGADLGLQQEDPTLAAMLRDLGYTTGQFGKNHLGDRDEHLPTNNGFDEFFGNLYHLNAEEEPEHPDYPDDPAFRERFGPRGVIRSTADGSIEDTGPLTRERMETVDQETLDAAIDFMDRALENDQPFFVWYNATRMHFRTHIPEEYRGVSGLSEYADAMIQHDDHVGELLDYLDDNGIVEDTIVMYSTDNGVHFNTWPDAGVTWYRGEKNSNWEGAYRVPAFIRWPGVIEPGSVSNEIMSHLDWIPTFMAYLGEDDIVERLREGTTLDGREYRVHLDGYNFLPYFLGEAEEGPRREFFYFNDDGALVALRYNRWKLVFEEQRARTLALWGEPFVSLRLPLMFDLRMDPFERAQHNSNTYWDWVIDHAFLVVPAQTVVANLVETFVEFPPRQRPASFNVEDALRNLEGSSVQ